MSIFPDRPLEDRPLETIRAKIRLNNMRSFHITVIFPGLYAICESIALKMPRLVYPKEFVGIAEEAVKEVVNSSTVPRCCRKAAEEYFLKKIPEIAEISFAAEADGNYSQKIRAQEFLTAVKGHVQDLMMLRDAEKKQQHKEPQILAIELTP
jgi:hypothetical protein